MVAFKTVSASDNPHPEEHERKRDAKRQELRDKQRSDSADTGKFDAQADRDLAEIKRQQARAAQAAGTEGNRDAVEAEARQGRGPAGLNTGPSNTVVGNPRDPMPQAGGHPYTSQPAPSTGGTGFSPPQGPQPTSDKPEYARPIEDSARRIGTDEAKEMADRARDERRGAQKAEREADKELREARRDISQEQGAKADGTGEGQPNQNRGTAATGQRPADQRPDQSQQSSAFEQHRAEVEESQRRVRERQQD